MLCGICIVENKHSLKNKKHIQCIKERIPTMFKGVWVVGVQDGTPLPSPSGRSQNGTKIIFCLKISNQSKMWLQPP